MKHLDRRSFMKMACAGTCGAAIHHALVPANELLALANPLALEIDGSLPVVVVVNLDGGSSYNVAPGYISAYRDAFPSLSFEPTASLPLSGQQGLHPALTGLKAVYDEGSLAVLNMMGYSTIPPNRSHAESGSFWQRGSTNSEPTIGGWGSRLTTLLAQRFASDTPLLGVSLGGQSEIVRGSNHQPLALDSLDGLNDFSIFPFYNEGLEQVYLSEVRGLAALAGTERLGKPSMEYVRGAYQRFVTRLDNVRNAAGAVQLTTQFPSSAFGRHCYEATRLIAATSLGVQFVYLSLGGFDTHQGEGAALNGLLTELNAGLTAMIAGLKETGRWGDTTIVTMSEFGRTFQNGSAGTDHGHGNCHFVMGGRVSGGIKTPSPALSDFGNGFFTTVHADFRDVYAELLNGMGLPGDAVFSDRPARRAFGLLRPA